MKKCAENALSKHKLGIIGSGCYVCFAAVSFMGSGTSFAVFVILFAASAVLFLTRHAAERVFIGKNSGAVYYIAAFSLFFLIFSIYSAVKIEPCKRLDSMTRSVTAQVLEAARIGGDNARITALGNVDGNDVRFTLFTSDTGLSAGDIFSAEVRFSEPAQSAVLREAYHSYSNGIFLSASARSQLELLAHKETGGVLKSCADYVRGVTERYLTGDEGALINAMFFGDSSGLSAELMQEMKRCGLSHLMAVSGLHLSIAVNFIAIILEMLFGRGHAKTRFIVILSATWLLAAFFGFSKSVCRSAVMMTVFYAALPLGRRPSSIDSLGFAVLMILLFEPYACRDAGLLLSVCGTLGLSAAASLPAAKRNRFLNGLVSAAFASLFTLPASALIFGGTSSVSPIASVICCPIFAFIMNVMLINSASGCIMAEPLLFAAGLAAGAIRSVAGVLSSFRYSFIKIDGDDIPIMILAAVYILTAAAVLHKKRYAARAAAVSLCVALCNAAVNRLMLVDTVTLRVYSDGSRGMMTVESDEGISVLTSGIGSKLYSRALDALTESGERSFRLVAAVEKEKSGMFSRGFDTLPCDMRCGDGSVSDVDGRYTVTVNGGVITADIYGVTVSLAPAGTNNTFSDLVVYSGYKKDIGRGGGTETFFCDKRCDSGTENAYYSDISIIISKDGRIRRRE